MNTRRITLSLLIASLLLAIVLIPQYVSQSPVTEENLDSVVARVAGRAITGDAFARKMLRRSGGFSGQYSTTEQKQVLLDEMINYELQLARAIEAGYAEDPEIIAKMERIMIGKLREEQLEKQLAEISLSEAEINAYYQQHLSDYTAPEKSRIAVIRFALPKSIADEKRLERRTLAEEILNKAAQLPVSARGFGALAAKHSDHQSSRYIGGDIGWYVAGKGGRFQNQAIKQAVADLSIQGELSPVVEASDGYYLLKLMEVREQQLSPLLDVRARIEALLLSQKRLEAEASWLALLRRDDLPVEINLSALKAIEPPDGVAVQKQNLRPANMPNG